MKGFFITATGTGIGKTLITAALCHQLRAKGKTVKALKPVISGFDAKSAQESDTGILLAAQGMQLNEQSIASVSPWRFAAPLSPNMAAEDENRIIDLGELCDFCQSQKDIDFLLIEGVGGVMVPLDAMHTVLDWMKALALPVILVAGSALGTLNHTLLSAHAIQAAGLKLQAVIISESENGDIAMKRTQATLQHFLGAIPIVPVRRLDSCTHLWETVPAITNLVMHEPV